MSEKPLSHVGYEGRRDQTGSSRNFLAVTKQPSFSVTQTQQPRVTQITTDGCIPRPSAAAIPKYPLTHLALIKDTPPTDGPLSQSCAALASLIAPLIVIIIMHHLFFVSYKCVIGADENAGSLIWSVG